jgi:hypothetical protein
MRLIPKRFRYSPASPVTLCGTAAVACYPAAIAHNSLNCKPSRLFRAAWHSRCLVGWYSRGRSGVRPAPVARQRNRAGDSGMGTQAVHLSALPPRQWASGTFAQLSIGVAMIPVE